MYANATSSISARLAVFPSRMCTARSIGHPRGFKPREAQTLLGLQPDAPVTDMLPLRYRLLAAEALQLEEISQGQFARFVGLDMIAARELYESLREYFTITDEGKVGAIDLDLGETITHPK